MRLTAAVAGGLRHRALTGTTSRESWSDIRDAARSWSSAEYLLVLDEQHGLERSRALRFRRHGTDCPYCLLNERKVAGVSVCDWPRWIAGKSRGRARAYGASDLLEYALTTHAHVADGFMTVEALAKAAITNSDNTAAKLLLTKVGGPPGLTLFARQLGNAVTRLDRNEPTLNENAQGDVRDTTSPRAMANLMCLVLCGDVLSRAGRDRLTAWLNACETGTARLRAGIPAAWIVGDKTGTGQRRAVNDVAFVVPPCRAPIVIAAYLNDSASSIASLNAAHAQISRSVVRIFVPSGTRGRGPQRVEL